MDVNPKNRKPDVLRKLNRENLAAIERGLLGDIPQRLRPQRPTTLDVPPRSTVDTLKPPGILASCLPIQEGIATSPVRPPEESTSPLKKTFSFRDRLARINLFSKDKEKQKLKERPLDHLDGTVSRTSSEPGDLTKLQAEGKGKRFWFFKHKDQDKKDIQSPLVSPMSPSKEQRWPRRPKGSSIYVRSKSFEFLPRALEDYEEDKSGEFRRNRHSYIFGSRDTMGTAWSSNDSLQFITPKNQELAFLNPQSSASNTSTGSSTRIDTIFERESVQNLIDEFDKAVELFQDENYLSDSEVYRERRALPQLFIDHRKSSSFSALPSPKVVQVCPTRAAGTTDTFKRELASAIAKTAVPVRGRTARRGSVTDWAVLEEPSASVGVNVSFNPKPNSANKSASEKYRRTTKKPVNRVRRVSSTKYWITQEESLLYSQEQRPPYIIPRITSYRAYRADPQRPVAAPRHHDLPLCYPEESLPVKTPQLSIKDVRQIFEGGRGQTGEWSPLSDRTKIEIERDFSKAGSDSPPLIRVNKRFGSNENLLNVRRPNYLAAGSGESLELELRGQNMQERRRKSKSMMAARHAKSPVPAPRTQPPLQHHGDTAEAPIFEEYVKRTKFSENGKKSRKNWTENYLVLTHTHLVFYKDMKAYHAALQKGSGAPPSPTGASRSAELVLPLQNAAVMKCTPQHTSRYARSIAVSSGTDQILIQDESPAGAAYWYDIILKTITKLPGGDTMMLEPPGTPTSSVRKNSKKVGESSNEDLSDSAEHAKVRKKLKKLLTRRPTKEALIKKGFYKDEPVFGRSLEEVCPGPEAAARVPEFVVRCVQEIESSEANMHTDGLYRASGNLSQVQKIRLQIDQNNLDIVEQHSDVHVLTGSLKLFFRELKEPLIPCKLFNRILSATGIKNRDARIKEFRDIVNSLPQCNWDTLKFLLEHLLRVTEHAAQNRMHIANLAIVFGPTLLWAPAELAHNIAIDCIQQNHAIEILLTDFHQIFSHDRHKKS